MKNASELARKLSKALPESKVAVDLAENPTGSSWIDIRSGDHVVTVEYRPGLGYGVSTHDREDGLGQGPDEVYAGADEAFSRVLELVAKRELTLEPQEILLGKLRRHRNVTQQDLAMRMRVQQAAISKMERRDDMLLSTLRKAVAGMGGLLEVRAIFPDSVVQIVDFDSGKPVPSQGKKPQQGARG